MDVKLIVLDGPKAGHAIAVKHKSFVIGRDDDCQLRARSARISRRHCELIVSDTEVLLRDLGGKIGTLLNDERVAGEPQLHSGDTIKVGPLRFKVVMSASATGKARREQEDTKQPAAPTDEPAGPSAGDIDGWLSDEALPARPIKREPASPQHRRVDERVSADETTPSNDSDESAAGDEDGAAAPKFEQPPPPKSVNSSDAADEMLRRMRRGS